MKWFWLSFADGSLPEGEQFLGALVLPVDDTVTALIEQLDYTDRIDLLRERGQEKDVPFYVAVSYSHLLGLNPGGEVQGWEITAFIDKVPEDMRNRLLTREEVDSIGRADEIEL